LDEPVEAVDLLERILAVPGADHRIAAQLECLAHDLAELDFILDDEARGASAPDSATAVTH
jgi:hypothetical protein